MGKTISESTFKRLESLQRRGRLCGGAMHCYSSAQFIMTVKAPTNQIVEVQLCRRHAKEISKLGKNQEIVKVEPY